MKPIETLPELRRELKNTTSGVAGDTIFSAKAVLFICERLVDIEKALTSQNGGKPKPKPKRKPSEWQRFFTAGMKANKSAAQVGAEWRDRKTRS